ncbi:hypothetical protein [Streptomyces sp. NBC_00102]|uniref:hypothetical protein n=1 Tax=Streptomyces sp. NBC_00102 TaxID=2975652 RepID=UPI0022576C50|nr:hypothetical protein [Streptomyces sp. NBC_00102]MCX5397253.1 hypothetical protein [Streptomyces sp. NBC_00102]
MRSLPLTICATAAVAAISVSAPAASAVQSDGGTLRVTPSTTAPGGEVELWSDVACGKGGKGGKGKEAVGESEAFVVPVRFAPADGKGLRAGARVRYDAEAGRYDVTIRCEGRDGTGGRATATLTVVHHARPTPVAPVRAGGGGTAVLATGATGATEAVETGESDGPGIRHVVAGLALAAVAAATAAFRGARRRRPAVD